MSLKGLSALLAQTSLYDHEEILEASTQAVRKSGSDLYAHRCRVIALLKLDRFEEALSAFESGGDPLKNEAQLEYSYALYKTGMLEKAEQIAHRSAGNRSLRHVEAQSSYRLERFARARQVYTELTYPHQNLNDEENDIRINSGASDAQLHWSGQGHLARKAKADREDMEQFETAFNAACGYIARGEYKQAATLLSRAKDLCNAAEELSDAEKQAEIMPIIAQQTYVLLRLGRVEEAEKLSPALDINQLTDPATHHIAQVNALLVSKATQNPFMAHRLFHSSAIVSLTDKPFKIQSSLLHRNSLALELTTGKLLASHAKGDGDNLEESISRDAIWTGVFRAAAQARSQTGSAALKQTVALLEKRPKDLGLLLTVVHLYLLANNVHMAIMLLERHFRQLEGSSSAAHQKLRFTPGLVALQASLNTELNQSSHSKFELAKAASYWAQQSSTVEDLSPLFAATGVALLANPSAKERQSAQELFANLEQRDPSSPVAIAGLAATLEDDTLIATSLDLDGKLPSLSITIGKIDTVTLEAAGVARPTLKPGLGTSRKRQAAEVHKTSLGPKKARTPRMPKDCDTGKKPDPERWLPLRDRTNWRPKGKKKGRVGAGMSTQGGAVSEDSRPSTPSQTIQAKQNPSKSKKKGKR